MTTNVLFYMDLNYKHNLDKNYFSIKSKEVIYMKQASLFNIFYPRLNQLLLLPNTLLI